MSVTDLIDQPAGTTITSRERDQRNRDCTATYTITRTFPRGGVEALCLVTAYEKCLGRYVTDRHICTALKAPSGQPLSQITEELPWVIGAHADADTAEARDAAHQAALADA